MVLGLGRHSVTVLCLAVIFSLDETTVSATTASKDTKRTIYIPLTDALTYEQTVKLGYVVIVLAAIISFWYHHFGKGVPTMKLNSHSTNPSRATLTKLHRIEDSSSNPPAFGILLDALDLYEEMHHTVITSDMDDKQLHIP